MKQFSEEVQTGRAAVPAQATSLWLDDAAGDTDAKTASLMALVLSVTARRCRNRAARERLQVALRAGLDAARILERQERLQADARTLEAAHA